MRIRTIKPSFWSSATMATVSRDARLVFIGLWNIADDEGRLLGGAKGLAGALFEHDDDVDSRQMSAWLDELEGRRLIERYSVKGTAYICVSGFGEHQKIDKRFPSRLPPPPEVVGEPPRLLSDGSEGSWREVGGKSASEVGSRKSEVGSRKLECESAASPPKQLTPPAAVVAVEAGEPAEVDPEPTTLQRLERREGAAVVRSGQRSAIASKGAAASAVFGRPQTVDQLLALRVTVSGDGRMQMAPDHAPGTPLSEIWGDRYKPLDGRGEPRRPSIAEVLERVWEASLSKPWQTDSGGWGTRYLAWWSGILATDAAKARHAWERDGAGAAADPDRAAAKRKYIGLQATRDMPPFDTWYVETWSRGRADDDLPEFDGSTVPSSQGSGSAPPGPRSGSPRTTKVIADADVAKAYDPNGAAGLELMKAATAAARAKIKTTNDSDEVRS